jgi:hypothetical protein
MGHLIGTLININKPWDFDGYPLKQTHLYDITPGHHPKFCAAKHRTAQLLWPREDQQFEPQTRHHVAGKSL